jgi:outer membrane protein, multidrug efflux system
MKIRLRLFRQLSAEQGDRGIIPSLPVLALLPLFLLLAGCRLGPNYRVPDVSTPAVFRGAAGAARQESYADLPWWDVFHDETLRQLIREALRNNQDMAAATARVEQARQIAAEARSEYFPAVGYATVLSYGHNQFTGSPASNTQNPQGFLLALVRATWEVDLWGRIRRTNEAARAQLLASEEVRRGVMLTLSSDLSQAYFELLGLRYRLEIGRSMVQTYTSTLRIFTERFQGGLGNQLQTSRASADLAAAAASLPEMERLVALKENQISVLLGKAPSPIDTKAKLLEENVPLNVPAGLPSALLERRPDVLAAAAFVRAANAQIGIARAAYFPALGLTTFFGKLSTPLADVTSGHTDAWTLASNVTGPIYQGGFLKARTRQAVAEWEEARARYVQTALNAFRDVSDALSSREKFDAVRPELIRAVQQNDQAVRISTARYLEGLSSYIEILDAEQRLYPAQLALADTEVARRLVLVQLYRALGGGWNLSEAQWFAGAPVVGAPVPGKK